MSYVHMDHAGWVQRQIDGTYCGGKPTAAERRTAADGKGWWAAPHQLTPFQKRAFDILGIVGGGIYNAPITWTSLRWDSRQIIVPWRYGLGTWDRMDLTTLVFLCHEARIRGFVEGGGFKTLRIWLSERESTGDISRRHPSMDEALTAWRAEFPPEHRIRVDQMDAPALAVA